MNQAVCLILRNRRFLMYCAIGLSGVMLDFVIYSLLLRLSLVGYQQANVAGYLGGSMLSFVLNSRYNFRITDRLLQRFVLFVGVAALGLAASSLTLRLLIDWFSVDRYLAKAVTLVAVVVIQYNLNRWVSFRQAT